MLANKDSQISPLSTPFCPQSHHLSKRLLSLEGRKSPSPRTTAIRLVRPKTSNSLVSFRLEYPVEEWWLSSAFAYLIVARIASHSPLAMASSLRITTKSFFFSECKVPHVGFFTNIPSRSSGGVLTCFTTNERIS